MKLSSNLAGPLHHCYLVTSVTMVQKRYQSVTHEYCNQTIDLLSVYFMMWGSRSPSDTTGTQRHISGLSSTIIFNPFFSLIYNHLLHFT
jgi:hypothetical protein